MSTHTKRRLSATMAGLAIALIPLAPASAAESTTAAPTDTVQANVSESVPAYKPWEKY
ncbi:hypothetical protein [Micromonospora eburnea]|uniref:Uncharacterized protein n=1 Tax=Micromonospora eburnea TaxID=227316 RepID=A0A1C6UZ16_9ACTN|nr:hypothetical protein [Micromonospora eburnea]SCL59261.1 hypothetical protein GA0070604_4015 [Micromonospora eburnea]